MRVFTRNKKRILPVALSMVYARMLFFTAVLQAPVSIIDTPFPKTYYAHALQLCMKACTEIELLQSDSVTADHLAHLILGRLVRLKAAIDLLVVHEEVSCEDIAYLYHMVAQLESCSKQSIAQEEDTSECINFIIQYVCRCKKALASMFDIA